MVAVEGPNRVKFLHNLLSNDITGLPAGRSALAALMNIKGQQVAWMRVMAEGQSLICELPAAVREAVVETFTHYKVGAPVRFAAPNVVVFALVGDRAPDSLKSLGAEALPASVDTFTSTRIGGVKVRISRGSDIPASGFTLHLEAADAPAFEARLRSEIGEPTAVSTLDALRIEEGIPWHGIDVVPENLLHETGQLNAYHSSSKGCYLGQEVVARLEGRGGNVNKRLRGFRVDGAVAAGAEIGAGDTSIGRVTTAGVSSELGNIAMGYVHRSHSEPGTKVTIDNKEAEVVELPLRRP